LRAVSIEVVVDQDRDFSGNHPRIRGLLGHDGLVLGHRLEPVDRGREVVQRSAQRPVDRHGGSNADERARGVEEADHAFVLWIGKILPARRNRLPTQGVHVHEKAKRPVVDGEPRAVRILEIGGNLVPVLRGLVRFDDAGVFGLNGEADTEMSDVRHGIRLLGNELRERLAGILVVGRHRDACLLLDDPELRLEVRPLRRTVVAGRGLRRRDTGESDGERNRDREEDALGKHLEHSDRVP
jgi:hypothetical protein